jgi:hypothetical protein
MSEYCQIRVKTHLDLDWSAWFDQLTITHDADGCTTIAGVLADQAALYGLIGKVRNLGLTLVAVQRIAAEHFGPTE